MPPSHYVAGFFYSHDMQTHDVLVLGAGFSKAVHDSMPDLATLRDRALEEAGLTNDPRVPSWAFQRGYTFEDWLSTLSEDQPHLSEQENRTNAALFARLRDAIVLVLTSDEAEASASDTPRWLNSLIHLIHHRRATVITLNYDRLFEVALIRANLRDLESNDHRQVDDRSALLDIPPTRIQQLSYRDVEGWKPSLTMRFLKLHGSLDWWMSPGDASGSTLVREELRFNGSDMLHYLSTADHSRRFTGREVFLVPPIFTKGTYVTNLVTRQLWSDAHLALVRANRVAIVGYSLPPGDSMMSAMMVSALQRDSVAVDIVDLSSAEVAARAGRLGIDPVGEFSGEESIANYVAHYLDRADAEFCVDFQKPSPLSSTPLPLVVTTGSGDHTNLLYRVIGIDHVNGDELVLRTVKKGNVMQNAASNESFAHPSELPTARDLAVALQGATKVVVDLNGTPDGICRPVRALPGPSMSGAMPVATLLLVVPEPNPSRLA